MIEESIDHLEQIRQAQKEDPTFSQVMKYCQEGWPAKRNSKGSVKQYWLVCSELCIHDKLLLRTHRIVIPYMSPAGHTFTYSPGAQGIVKCRLRERTSVWWPGLSQQIKTMIEHCKDCCQNF